MNRFCQCGCGEEVFSDKNRFINGHNSRCRSEDCKKRLYNKIRGRKNSLDTIIKMSISATGRTHSEETKLKISKNNEMTGKHHTEDIKKKISQANLGMKQPIFAVKKSSMARKGIKRSFDTRHKMSLSAINRLVNGNLAIPNVGRNEKYILDKIYNGLDFLRNDHNISSKTGKFIDGYLSKYNLAVEILEPHHFKLDGQLSENDRNRELIISSKLACMIYYVSEQEFLKNSENEILRFKNFLQLLDQGVN